MGQPQSSSALMADKVMARKEGGCAIEGFRTLGDKEALGCRGSAHGLRSPENKSLSASQIYSSPGTDRY